MTDREKVIKGLECCKIPFTKCYDGGCPYFENDGCKARLKGDALALLKAQEPKVMTWEEVERHNNQDGCVWFEQPTYNAVAAFVRKDDEDYTEIISPYLLGEPINHGYMANRFYGKAWRCWTSRPTDAQREATPWERLN